MRAGWTPALGGKKQHLLTKWHWRWHDPSRCCRISPMFPDRLTLPRANDAVSQTFAANDRHSPNSMCAGFREAPNISGLASLPPALPVPNPWVDRQRHGQPRSCQKLVDRETEPAGMTRLQGDRTRMYLSQSSEKLLCDTFVKGELRRKLEEHGSQFVAETAHRVKELQQSAAGIHQFSHVG